jgi:hypothetical protein
MKKIVLLLPSRLLLFLAFQTIIALLLSSWEASSRYWLVTATLANFVGVLLLAAFMRKEGSSFLSLFRFDKATIKGDALWFVVIAVISVPVAIGVSFAISTLLWGNTTYYHQVLFQPMTHRLAYMLLVLCPLSTGLAELPTYFGYIMPRLKSHVASWWLVVLIPVVAFSVQHCTLPLVNDARFIFFRGTMYFPFVLIYGLAMYKRPSLLPWLSILQMLIYVLPVLTLLSISI